MPDLKESTNCWRTDWPPSPSVQWGQGFLLLPSPPNLCISSPNSRGVAPRKVLAKNKIFKPTYILYKLLKRCNLPLWLIKRIRRCNLRSVPQEPRVAFCTNVWNYWGLGIGKCQMWAELVKGVGWDPNWGFGMKNSFNLHLYIFCFLLFRGTLFWLQKIIYKFWTEVEMDSCGMNMALQFHTSQKTRWSIRKHCIQMEGGILNLINHRMGK